MAEMSLIFPMAFMANNFAMTILLILLGLADKSGTAAEIGIVQGVTLALFYAFSANARSLILNPSSGISSRSVLAARLMLMVPLSLTAYAVSIVSVGIDPVLAVVLILRRCVEWIGEVHLSEMELLDDRKFARIFLMMQAIPFVLILGWMVFGLSHLTMILTLWALLPLSLSVGYLKVNAPAFHGTLVKVGGAILPNLGSTAIIGITVYLFRLLILLHAGRQIAGDLFASFAIGGLTGGVFANALGPSIVLHEQRSGRKQYPLMLKAALFLSLACGVFVFLIARMEPSLLVWTRKSTGFWEAVGLSLIGGVIMAQAQRIRFRLLQHDEEFGVFGPDVMMNVMIVAAVPFTYYLLGTEAMGGLYLLSAILALLLYSSAKKWMSVQRNMTWIMAGLAALLLMPIFVQTGNGLFLDHTLHYDTGGKLTNLPLPLSVVACFAGIILLGEYEGAFLSFSFIFLTCLLMAFGAMLSSKVGPLQESAKLMQMIQFILPMFALVLGQFFVAQNGKSRFERAFLYLLAFIVPLHLLASWWQGSLILLPFVGLFSIYQYMEYVPGILICAYLVSLYSLWDAAIERRILLILAPLMAVYAAASMSATAMTLLLAGFVGLGYIRWRLHAEKIIPAVLLVVTALAGGYLHFEKIHAATVGYTEKEMALPVPAGGRTGVISATDIFLVGHEGISELRHSGDRSYYRDLFYNFGLLASLPVAGLLGYTLFLAYRHRAAIFSSTALAGLCLVTLFELFVDNSMKAGMRQPYPGIFTFFLWGMLLSQLLGLKKAGEAQ